MRSITQQLGAARAARGSTPGGGPRAAAVCRGVSGPAPGGGRIYPFTPWGGLDHTTRIYMMAAFAEVPQLVSARGAASARVQRNHARSTRPQL